MSNVDVMGDWIDVDERLPTIDLASGRSHHRVIVFAQRGLVFDAWLQVQPREIFLPGGVELDTWLKLLRGCAGEIEWIETDTGEAIEGVTHWTPLINPDSFPLFAWCAKTKCHRASLAKENVEELGQVVTEFLEIERNAHLCDEIGFFGGKALEFRQSEELRRIIGKMKSLNEILEAQRGY